MAEVCLKTPMVMVRTNCDNCFASVQVWQAILTKKVDLDSRKLKSTISESARDLLRVSAPPHSSRLQSISRWASYSSYPVPLCASYADAAPQACHAAEADNGAAPHW